MRRGAQDLRRRGRIAATFMALCACVASIPVAAAAACSVAGQAPPGLQELAGARDAERIVAPLRAALARQRFVAYQPTSLQVHDGRVTRASAASIRADLAALRPYFDALVTYDVLNGAEQVPAIAAALGFRALLLGVWDPFDDAQVEAALAAARAHPALVVGVSLGNETIFGKRRSHAELAARLAAIRRRAPGLALSTTEPFHLLLEPRAAPLLAQLDFLLANVHPVFEAWFRDAPDANAAAFGVDVAALLAARHCGPLLVKETGVPTAPARQGYSPARQRSFYVALQRAFPPTPQRAFAWFAAFDAPWRAADWHPVPGEHPEEAHWGLFDAQRRPKPVVEVIPRLGGR